MSTPYPVSVDEYTILETRSQQLKGPDGVIEFRSMMRKPTREQRLIGVNMARTVEIDTKVAAELFQTNEDVTQKGGVLVLFGVTTTIQDKLNHLKLLDKFTIVTNLDAAIKRLRQKVP
jgi:anti-anti-sigma regulatory factor